MSEIGPIEVANCIAAVVSAVGGCFAAVAAFRSAQSAQEAAHSADAAAHRASLRELSGAATSVVAECIAIRSIASELTSECKAAEAFSGSAENANLQALIKSFQELTERTAQLSQDAELFTNGAPSLRQAPIEEVDRVITRMNEHLAIARVIREDMLRKYASMASMNNAERSRRLSKLGA